MKSRYAVWSLLAAIGLPLSAVGAHAQTCNVSQSAQYRIVFDATWSAETLPNQFPSNAHFFRLGWRHTRLRRQLLGAGRNCLARH